MALRGFDDYELTLGDEMRGERACLGKTLEDVERDLCIKVDMLAAIENADLEAFPNRSVVPGYVRSYARYLGMDPTAVYERFCRESGFRSPLASIGMTADPAVAARKKDAGAIFAGAASGLAQSRFVGAPRSRRIGAPVSLGGLFSALALVGLVGGLAYGGYALLQDIQRVGFAPLPEAPAVVADAPVIAAPDVGIEAMARAPRPDASAYENGGVLALDLPSELPAPYPGRRDGPISAIDPATSGVFAARMDHAVAMITGETSGGRPLPVFAAVTPVEVMGPFRPGEGPAATGLMSTAAETSGQSIAAGATSLPPVDPDRVELVVSDEAWVRIRDAAGAVVFEALMKAGERFELPERIESPTLRAGNAGSVYVRVGDVLHGPIGRPGGVVKSVSLAADDLRGGVPVAASLPDTIGEAAGEMRSAAAEIAR